MHVVAFTALGALISFMVHEAELHTRHPFAVMLVAFVLLQVGFLVIAPLLVPDAIALLGAARVGGANLLAAGTIAVYFLIQHRAKDWEKLEHAPGDLVYDSFFAGAVGGSAVALFFLFTDLLDGQPLFTPSLIGQVLFQGVPPEEVTRETSLEPGEGIRAVDARIRVRALSTSFMPGRVDIPSTESTKP